MRIAWLSLIFPALILCYLGINWSLACIALVLFLLFDIPFLFANLLKLADGGYIPMLIGLVFFTIMFVWRKGRSRLEESLDARARSAASDIAGTIERLCAECHTRVPGTGVFLVSSHEEIPPILPHYVRRVGALHQTVLMLTLEFEHAASLRASRPIELEDLGHGFHRAVAHFGFMEKPHLPRLLDEIEARFGLPLHSAEVTYFVGRETVLTRAKHWPEWLLERLFVLLARNARPASDYFRVPPSQIVELGLQVDI